MYAIIETGGKQYRVTSGDVIYVEKLNAAADETVVFDKVVALSDDNGELKIGAPYVDAKVEGVVLKNGKSKKITVFTYKPKMGTEQAVQDLIGDICISMKAEDYLTLPECVSVDVPVVLDSKAAKAYTTMEREMLLEVAEDTITADTAAVLTNKLLQLAGGAVYNAEHEAQVIHSCKIEAFLELVESLAGKSALVFYGFQHEKERILAALAMKHKNLRVRVFSGPQDEDDWNAGKIDILLAHPASTAYGLNLQQGGNHVIWFSPTWSLELYQQANKRLHRQGQTERVIIHRLLVDGSVDHDVVAALEGKADTQEALMESIKARIEQVRKENL